jgi:pilus assembly protein Flp/PilA
LVPARVRDYANHHHVCPSWTCSEFAIVLRRLAKVALKFVKADDGPTAVEYAVMLALIMVVCITAVATLGNNSKTTYTKVSTTLGATGS